MSDDESVKSIKSDKKSVHDDSGDEKGSVKSDASKKSAAEGVKNSQDSNVVRTLSGRTVRQLMDLKPKPPKKPVEYYAHLTPTTPMIFFPKTIKDAIMCAAVKKYKLAHGIPIVEPQPKKPSSNKSNTKESGESVKKEKTNDVLQMIKDAAKKFQKADVEKNSKSIQKSKPGSTAGPMSSKKKPGSSAGPLSSKKKPSLLFGSDCSVSTDSSESESETFPNVSKAKSKLTSALNKRKAELGAKISSDKKKETKEKGKNSTMNLFKKPIKKDEDKKSPAIKQVPRMSTGAPPRKKLALTKTPNKPQTKQKKSAEKTDPKKTEVDDIISRLQKVIEEKTSASPSLTSVRRRSPVTISREAATSPPPFEGPWKKTKLYDLLKSLTAVPHKGDVIAFKLITADADDWVPYATDWKEGVVVGVEVHRDDDTGEEFNFVHVRLRSEEFYFRGAAIDKARGPDQPIQAISVLFDDLVDARLIEPAAKTIKSKPSS